MRKQKEKLLKDEDESDFARLQLQTAVHLDYAIILNYILPFSTPFVFAEHLNLAQLRKHFFFQFYVKKQ